MTEDACSKHLFELLKAVKKALPEVRDHAAKKRLKAAFLEGAKAYEHARRRTTVRKTAN